MATAYVHAERGHEFRDLFLIWKRQRDPGSIVMEPPEGPPLGEEKQFVMVDDDFLPYMRAKGFPFRAG
jgi:hypothetical protein